MRLSLFGTAIFSAIVVYMGQHYLERLMPNQAAVFALPHPDLDPDGRGDFLYRILFAAEDRQACMCWPNTACDQGTPPPEDAFKLEITGESGRNQRSIS